MREQSGRTEAGNDRETGSVSQKYFHGTENSMSLYELIFAWIIIWTRFRPFLLEQFSRIKRKRCSQTGKRILCYLFGLFVVWIIFHPKVSVEIDRLFSSLIGKRVFDKNRHCFCGSIKENFLLEIFESKIEEKFVFRQLSCICTYNYRIDDILIWSYRIE